MDKLVGDEWSRDSVAALVRDIRAAYPELDECRLSYASLSDISCAMGLGMPDPFRVNAGINFDGFVFWWEL